MGRRGLEASQLEAAHKTEPHWTRSFPALADKRFCAWGPRRLSSAAGQESARRWQTSQQTGPARRGCRRVNPLRASTASNHGLAQTEGKRERARSDPRGIEVGRDVEIGRAHELVQALGIDELILEDNVLFEFVLGGQNFSGSAVGFSIRSHFIGMGGSEHDVHHIRELRQNRR